MREEEVLAVLAMNEDNIYRRVWLYDLLKKEKTMEQLEDVVQSVLDQHVDLDEAKKALSDGAFPAGTYDVLIKRFNVRPPNPESFTPNRITVGVNLRVTVDEKTVYMWEDLSPDVYFSYVNGDVFKAIAKDDPDYHAGLKHDRKYRLFAKLAGIVNVSKEPLTNKEVLERLDNLSLRAKIAEMFTVADGSKAFAWDSATRETYMTEGFDSKNIVIDFFA